MQWLIFVNSRRLQGVFVEFAAIFFLLFGRNLFTVKKIMFGC